MKYFWSLAARNASDEWPGFALWFWLSCWPFSFWLFSFGFSLSGFSYLSL
jgi:hypothetical protein